MKLNVYVLMLVCAAACVTVNAGDFVVVVSAKAPVDKLSSEQVSQIFLGKTDFFPSGETAVPVDQAESAAIRNDFDTKVLGKSPSQLKAYWSKVVFTGKGHPPKEVASSGDVKSAIGSNPAAIGYIEKAAVDASVKVVYSE